MQRCSDRLSTCCQGSSGSAGTRCQRLLAARAAGAFGRLVELQLRRATRAGAQSERHQRFEGAEVSALLHRLTATCERCNVDFARRWCNWCRSRPGGVTEGPSTVLSHIWMTCWQCSNCGLRAAVACERGCPRCAAGGL